MAGPFTAAEIAARLGGEVEGDGGARLVDVRGLEEAGPEHLSFLANRRYAPRLRTSAAGAVLVDRQTRVPAGRTVIRCADPYAAFARSLAIFHPLQWPAPGVSPQAHVDPAAIVDPSAHVEAFAWVGPGARVGARTWVESGVRIGAGAHVGSDCRLMAHSAVCEGCLVGDRVWLNPGAVVGSEGFGFAPTPAGHVKIPQVGRAVVEDDVELGANACVDRAALGETRVGKGTKTDNMVQLGHAAQIGQHGLMVAYSGIAGSSKVGDRCVLAGRATVLGHLTVGDDVQLGFGSAVHGDLPAGSRVSGVPAIDHRRWLRAATAFADLPDALKQLRRLEAALAAPADRIEGAVPDRPSPAPEIPAQAPPRAAEQAASALDIRRILALLPHRYPFLMLDRVLEVEPGVRAVGVKCVSIGEPHFQGHFPQLPIMPGVLITEAFAQLAGVVAVTAHPDFSEKAFYLMGLDKVRFRRPVQPGDRLTITCEKLQERRGVWRFAARAEVDGQRAAEGEVMATVADRQR